MIVTDARPEVIEELNSMVEQGVTSFKCFLAYPGALMVDDDTLFAVMERAAGNGGLVMIHAENDGCVRWLTEKLLDSGRHGMKYHGVARNRVGEREATYRAIAFSELIDVPITGMPVP